MGVFAVGLLACTVHAAAPEPTWCAKAPLKMRMSSDSGTLEGAVLLQSKMEKRRSASSLKRAQLLGVNASNQALPATPDFGVDVYDAAPGQPSMVARLAGSALELLESFREEPAPASEDTAKLKDAIIRWHGDVFDRPGEAHAQKNSDTPKEIWTAPPEDWVLLGGTVLGLMALDFLVFRNVQSHARGGPQTVEAVTAEPVEGKMAQDIVHQVCESPEPEPEIAEKKSKGGGFTADSFVLVCWILCGFAFNAVIFWLKGREAGIHWCNGYFLEWILSMDNIFIFHVVFQTYKTPPELLHKALFLGILGAVICRIFFFMALTQLMGLVHWIRFVFGLILIYSGVMAAKEDDDDGNPADSMAMQILMRLLGDRILDKYDLQGHRLFVTENQKVCATLLVPVIFCLEITDILFAIDSVSAKVAQIPDVYLAYSSSVLAMFGLRAMFFVVQDMVEMFELLKYGLCFILVFIGLELLVSDFVQLPAQVVCMVIFATMIVCIAGSWTKTMLSPRDAHGAREQTTS